MIYKSCPIFLLIGNLTNWTGRNLLTAWQNLDEDNSRCASEMVSVVVSDVNLAGHWYFQLWILRCFAVFRTLDVFSWQLKDLLELNTLKGGLE